ncbi:MAG TPA: hypothetical protein VK196_09425 [Magnetospirillum sp.]|nr:hypothetical protein [Magnetospirillum sp.]
MFRRLGVVALAGLVLAGCGPDEHKEKAKKAVLTKMAYPADTKFQSLDKFEFQKKTMVCGQFERRKGGQPTGEFVKFFYDEADNSVVVADDKITRQMVLAWCMGMRNAAMVEPLSNMLGPDKQKGGGARLP